MSYSIMHSVGIVIAAAFFAAGAGASCGAEDVTQISARWSSVKDIIKQNLYLGAYASPGHYNDMDMLEVGRGMTETEDFTHFAAWCFMSSPLLIGCDLEKVKADARLRELLADKELIALNQDTAEPQGNVVRRDGESYVLARDFGEAFGTTRAVLFLNLGDEKKDLSVTMEELDLDPADAEGDAISVSLPPHGAEVRRVSGRHRREKRRYEAETAYLPLYQELCNAAEVKTAYYRESKDASGGMVVSGAGGREGNDIVFRRVWSRNGGDYELSIATIGEGAKPAVVVNGVRANGTRVKLHAGVNEIRLSGDGAVLPDIDYIELKPAPHDAMFIGAGPENGAHPAYVRREVVNEKNVTNAVWRVTGLGVFTPIVNMKRVTSSPDESEILMPGYTHFKKRRHEITIDITDKWNCAAGATNILSAIVTSGWWCDGIAGKFGGTWPAFRGVLTLTHDDGTVTEIPTDESWIVTTDTPVVKAGIWEGEFYDATKSVITDEAHWESAKVSDEFKGEISPRIGPPIVMRRDLIMCHRFEDGKPVPFCLKIKPGETNIVDFGQNCAAVPDMQFSAEPGTRVTVRLGEMLNDGVAGHHGDGPKGSVYLANMRGASATFEYVCKGGARPDGTMEHYHPLHTFYGYRYAAISADRPLLYAIASVPVSSISKEMERGEIETGDERVNRLVKNAYWSMLSNYLSVPTDCPQRTERLGWTGDTQVFAKTACYFADVRGFFAKWMQDVRDTQHADGVVPYVVPIGAFGDNGPIAGWSDAAVIVPWTLWRQLGDADVVRQNWAVMERYMARIAKDGYMSKRGNWLLCDWLSFEKLSVDQSKRWSNGGYTEDHLSYQNFLNACHLYGDALKMSELAAALSLEQGMDYADLARRTKERILATWFRPDGTLCALFDGMQTPALFALKLGLGDREKIAGALVDAIHANGDRLATGFLGTPLVCEVLSEIGESRLAYTLLLQREFPSWLYSVDQGATTIWERWNGYTKEGGFGDVRMNSFNHYAYGAVVAWLFEHAAGIQPDAMHGGWRHFTLAPEPDERLGRISAKYKTDFGVIESAWECESDGAVKYRVVVPPGTTASLRLPGCEVMELSEGEFIKTVSSRKASTPKCIVTYTFDDGLRDQYELAYPMFRDAGLKATFFIIGSKIGNPDGMRSKAESHTPTMTWAQVREMADAWENPDELRKHLQWVKAQKDVRVATFAEAASFAASEAQRAGHIPDDCRPKAWWFFGQTETTHEGITADAEAMKRVGFGGVVYYDQYHGENPRADRLWSDKWWDGIEFAASEAARLGLTFETAVGNGYVAGGSWIDPAHAMKTLAVIDRDTNGGKVTLPLPVAKDRGWQKTVAVLAIPLPDTDAKFVDMEYAGHEKGLASTMQHPGGMYGYREKTFKAVTNSLPKIPRWQAKTAVVVDFVSRGDTPVCVDMKDVRDVTEKFDESDRRLKCELPAGRWKVLRFVAVPTGGRTKHGRPEAMGLECDKMSVAAAELHWNAYTKKIIDRLKSKGLPLAGIILDSHEAGAQNWTDDMLKEFARRRGYDFRPYLPLMAGYCVAPNAEDVLADFRRTCVELIAERYYGTFDRLCREEGLSFTGQAGGGMFMIADSVFSKKYISIPEGEFWGYQKHGAYDVKDTSSAAHLYGKKVASAEAMTDAPYKMTIPELRRRCDLAFAFGANAMTACAVPHLPKKDCGVKTPTGPREYGLNRSNPWWEGSRPFWDYIAFCSWMLRQGEPAPEALFYAGDDVPVKIIASKVPKALGGLDWDFATGDAAARMTKTAEAWTTPEGIRYGYVVDSEGRTLAGTPPARRLNLPHIARLLPSGEKLAFIANDTEHEVKVDLGGESAVVIDPWTRRPATESSVVIPPGESRFVMDAPAADPVQTCESGEASRVIRNDAWWNTVDGAACVQARPGRALGRREGALPFRQGRGGGRARRRVCEALPLGLVVFEEAELRSVRAGGGEEESAARFPSEDLDDGRIQLDRREDGDEIAARLRCRDRLDARAEGHERLRAENERVDIDVARGVEAAFGADARLPSPARFAERLDAAAGVDGKRDILRGMDVASPVVFLGTVDHGEIRLHDASVFILENAHALELEPVVRRDAGRVRLAGLRGPAEAVG